MRRFENTFPEIFDYYLIFLIEMTLLKATKRGVAKQKVKKVAIAALCLQQIHPIFEFQITI